MGYWRAANEVLFMPEFCKARVVETWNARSDAPCEDMEPFANYRLGLSHGRLYVCRLWTFVKTCFQDVVLLNMFSGPLHQYSYIQFCTFLGLPWSKCISCTGCTLDHHSASIHNKHYDVCIYVVLHCSPDSFTPPHFAGAHSGPVHALAVPDREDLVQ